MRKLFTFVFFTLLALPCVQAQEASESENKCGDNLYWVLDEGSGVLTISGEGTMYDYSYQSRAPWQDSYESIKEVRFTGSPSNVGDWAFNGCSALARIDLPASVTNIGSYAFYGCNTLTSIDLPADVTTIEGYAFQKCSALTSIDFPAGVTSIGNSAFNGCVGLKQIFSNIATEDLFVPGSDAFLKVDKNNCTLYVPEGAGAAYAAAEQWGDFANIVELNNKCGDNLNWVLDEGSGVLTISGEGAMYDYSYYSRAPWQDSYESIKEVRFTGSPSNVGDWAFNGCSALARIDLPASVTNIGSYAFYGCSALTSIDLPADVTTIESYAFQNCRALTSIDLPAGVTSIGNGAFNGCSGITSIEFPAGVKSIGNYAFYGCSSLTSIEFPAGVTSIGNSAFGFCNSLASIISYIAAEDLFVPGESAFLDVDKNNCTLYVPAEAGAAYAAAEQWGDFTNIVELNNKCGDNLYWVLDEGSGTLNFFGGGPMYDYDSPSYAPWYESCEAIKKVEFIGVPTNFGDYAFYGCSSLTGIDLPAGVTSIGDYAFSGCSGLTGIDLPAGVTSIGDYAFSDCSGLTGIDLPAGVTSIGNGVFSGCSSLTGIDLPEAVKSIGDYAFSDCSGLTGIDLPAGVTSISDYVFSGCSALAGIDLPEGVTSIGDYAFSGCSALAGIELTAGVTSIGAYAFYGCSAFTSIELPAGVTSIGEGALGGCTFLKSICSYIAADNLFAPDSKAFDGVDKEACTLYVPLGTKDTYTATMQWMDFANIVEFNGKCGERLLWSLDEGSGVLTIYGSGAMYDFNSLSYAPWYKSREAIKKVEFIGAPTNIGYYAFYGCSSLTGIDLPAGVTNIGDNAFNACSSLAGIDLPAGVTNIGNRAFYGCSALTSIDLPAGVTDIGTFAFYECSSLTRIDLPAGVTDIGTYAFYDCSSLTSIISYIAAEDLFVLDEKALFGVDKDVCTLYVPDGAGAAYAAAEQWGDFTNIVELNNKCGDNLYWVLDEGSGTLNFFGGGPMYDYDSSSYAPWYNARDGIRVVNFAGGITSIGDYAFCGCRGLETVKLPESVTSIGAYAFLNCSNLTSVELPASVTSIGAYAFLSCSNLTSIELPAGVTSIGNGVFSGCSALTGIELPARVTNIGEEAFSGCSSLTGIELPAGVKSIGDYAFSNCRKITSIELPAGITSISDGIFSGCSSLTSIELPAGVKSIGDYVFSGCSGLAGIDLPAGVTNIGNRAFYGCSALTSIDLPAGVTNIGSRAFYGCSTLTSIELPAGVTNIKDYTFGNCTALTSIDISASVTNIGEGALSGCTSLKSIYSHIAADNLFAPGSKAFDGVDKEACTLYVPLGTKDTYTATMQWMDFVNIVEFKEVVNLVDGEPYIFTQHRRNVELTYSRTFGNANWQAWYVPFAIDYEQLSDEFEVAEINDIHQYDTDRDGAMDKTELEVVKMVAGTLQANYPYLIRAKEAGEKSIFLDGVTLEAARNTAIDCSSVKLKYYFVGTCAGLTGQEMLDGQYYALSGGSLMQAADNSAALKPLRWYMKIENRGEAVSAGVIRIRVLGDETTNVREVETEPRGEAVYYDLSGRRVENPTRGIYIVNGKKVYIK